MRWVKNNSNKFQSDDHRLISHLSGLLGKVLQHHDVDGLPDMILHELGHDSCFGLKRATYLVDNPDFNHLLGVAGYCKEECPCHKENLWETPNTFKEDMKNAYYHNDVKKFLHDSLKRKDIDLSSVKDVEHLGKHLGIANPAYFAWNMKHGNHGLLLFEETEKPIGEWRESLLANVAALLSFCGI